MGVDLAKLVVSLEAETAKYQKELEGARKKLSRFEKESNASVVKIAQGVGAATAAAATAFGVMAKAAIDNADRLAKLSQTTGVTTESLSELEYVAGLSGASSEELAQALNRLNKSSAEAAEGGKTQAAAFRQLGVEVTDAGGKMRSTEAILVDVAEAFSQIEDGPAKAAVAMDIFGKSGANLIPFLNNGRKGIADLRAEAAAFGLTVSGDAAKAAEQFNDNLDRLRAVAQGATNQITAGLLPTFTALTDAAVDFAKHSGAATATVDGMRVAFETIVVLGANVAFVLEGIGREIGGLVAQAGAVARLDFRGAAEIGRLMKEDAAAARAEIDAFSARVLGANEAANKVEATMRRWTAVIEASKTGKLDDQRAAMMGLAAAYKAGEFGAVGSAEATRAYEAAIARALPAVAKKRLALKGVGEEADKAAKALKGMLDALQTQAATLGMSAEQTELYKLKIAGASAAQLKFASDVLEGVRAFEEQKAALKEGEAVTESVRTPAEALAAEYERLGGLLDRGAVSQETFNRAIVEAQNAFIAADPEIQKAIKAHRELQELLEDTPTGKLEADRKLMQDLAIAYRQNAFGAAGSTAAVEQYGEAVNTALGNIPDKVEESTDLMKELTAEAARNMQGALADFLFDPFSDGVEGMADQFAKALQRMAAEAAAAQIMDSLGFGKSGGGSDLIGTLFSAGLSYFTGTQAPAPVAEASFTSIPGRASGGDMRAGRPYWTGEDGPELVFPGVTSRILSRDDSEEFVRGSRGAQQVNQTFNISTPDPDAFRASERQMARRARMGLQR